MSKETWDHFIGEYSVGEILEETENVLSVLYRKSLGEAIECIVESMYDDTDVWCTSPGYRAILCASYPDKDEAIKMIKQEVMDELELE